MRADIVNTILYNIRNMYVLRKTFLDFANEILLFLSVFHYFLGLFAISYNSKTVYRNVQCAHGAAMWRRAMVILIACII